MMNNGTPETTTSTAAAEPEINVDPTEFHLLEARPDLAALYRRFCQLSVS